jgi:hypothetical protein
VLFYHGHINSKTVAVLDAGSQYASAHPNSYVDAPGPKFAKSGFILFAPTIRGFGKDEVSDPPRNRHLHEVVEAKRRQRALLANYVADATRSLDFLAARPDVDREKMSVAGISLGSHVALFTAVVDRRATRAIVSGGLLSYDKAPYQNDFHCWCVHVPELDQRWSFHDFGAAVAPVPMLFQQNPNDPSFRFDEAIVEFNQIRSFYNALGLAPRVELVKNSGGHRFDSESALEWLRRQD